jgi:hypothetical protein
MREPRIQFDPVRALGAILMGAVVIGFWFGLATLIYQCSL